MTHPLGTIRLIANPRAGRGRIAAVLGHVRAVLDEAGLDHDVVETSGPGDATDLARRAVVDEGRDFIVAVGGDGTVHEVVNGMVDAEGRLRRERATLGILSAGSGCDFAKTFGLDRKPEVAVRHLANMSMMPVDLGVVECTGTDGAPLRRHFVNIAQVGYGALAVRKAERLPRWLGRVRYLLGAWGSIIGTDRQTTEVGVDHGSTTVDLVSAIVANGQFFGGGMKIAPRALADDGRFNVQLFTGNPSQMFVMTREIFRGEHLPHPDISEYQSSVVDCAPPTPMVVEADGEVLGTTPARFSMIPAGLRLKV